MDEAGIPIFDIWNRIVKLQIQLIEAYKAMDKRLFKDIWNETDAYNDDFIRGLAENSNWDADKLSTPDSRFDLDCDPNRPLEIVPDWGTKINLFSVGQERNFNFVTRMIEPVDCVINEFFIKPQTAKSMPVDYLVDQFCDYYKQHPCRDLFYYRDRYGVHRQPNVKNSKPYNEQAIERLEKTWMESVCKSA